jgi:hypothetical protein
VTYPRPSNYDDPGHKPRGDERETILDALFGPLVEWTPSLSNITQGSGGLITARYKAAMGETSGGMLYYRFKFVLGTGSAIGTAPRFTLPETIHGGYVAGVDEIGNGMLLDNGTANRQASVWVSSVGVNTAQIYAYGTTGQHVIINATTPWTWASGDVLSVSGFIELA